MIDSMPASPVGEVLAGKYRIVRFVGEGGMGTVYEAQHLTVGRRFAVKLLHSDLVKQDEILERFKREAQAAGALESENIASVVDLGQSANGIPYIVMEFLVGEDLARFFARLGPLPVPRAVNIAIQACRGLDAAHAVGIVHRDLKPENLFICRRGDGSDLVKILDFGIAKLTLAGVSGPLPSMTRTGATMGTPFYMSPEQARGAKNVDLRTDIYSLGVILFEALTGEKPHPGESYNEILYHILTQPPTPLSALRPGVPEELAELIHRALATDPDERPASAAELARALSRHAGRQVTPIHSQLDLRVTRSSGAGREDTPGAETVEEDTMPPGPIRRRLHWVVAGVAAVALVGTAAALLLRYPRSEKGAAALHAGQLPPAPLPSPPPATASRLAPAPSPLPASGLANPKLGAQPAPKPLRAAGTAEERKKPAKPAGRPRPSSSEGPAFDGRNPYE